MKRILLLLFAFAFAPLCPPKADAQVFVVATCGTVPASQATLTPGRPGMMFVDTNGVLCTSGSGGGGGGGAITMAPGAVSAGAYGAGALAAGSIASGALASGALAAGSISTGAFAAGAMIAGTAVDGWNLTLGKTDDSVCATATGTCTEIALLKYGNQLANSPSSALVSTAYNTNTYSNGANAGIASDLNGVLFSSVSKIAGVVPGMTGTSLNVNITGGAGSGGTASVDEATFTQGTTSYTPIGGLFTSSVTNLTTGQGGVARLTNDRQLMVSDASIVTALSAATPAGTNPIGGTFAYANVAGTQTALRACQSTAIINLSASGSTQLVALSSGQTIRVCGFRVMGNGTAVNFKLVYGTGTNCATSPADITEPMPLLANVGLVDDPPYWKGMAGAASNAVCGNLSAAQQVVGMLYYSQD